MDCITVERTGSGFQLRCIVWEEQPLSEIGFSELEDLFGRLESPAFSLSDEANCSEFEVAFPNGVNLEELVEDVRSCLRRDRTSRRRAELHYNSAPREGMAVALELQGLWPEHRLDAPVYVLEIANRPGRCIVMKHLQPTLVDLPLAQFRILSV